GRRVAVLVAAAAWLAVARAVLALEAEVEQRGQALVGEKDDVAAVPAIPARGAAPGDELLPAESDGARAAIARLHGDFRLVDEHERGLSAGARTRCSSESL